MTQPSFRRVRRVLAPLAASIALLVLPARSATLTWTNTTGNWSVPTNWNPNGTPNASETLVFGGSTAYTSTNDLPAAQANQLQFTATGAAPVIAAAPASAPLQLVGPNAALVAAGSGPVTVNLKMQLPSNVAWSGDGAGVITLNGGLFGVSDIVKTGNSTFRFGTLNENAPSENAWVGSLQIDGGTIRFNNNAVAGPTALRSNSVSLKPGATLLVQPGAPADPDNDPKAGLRVGTLSGTGGTVQARQEFSGGGTTNFDSATLLVTALTDGTFGGTVRNSAVGTGTVNEAAFTLRGEGKQTFTGTFAAAKDVFVGGRATLELGGSASLVAQTSGAIVLAGGNFRLNNAAGNLDRLRNGSSGTGLDTNGGGTFTLVGNSSGTTEQISQLQLGATKARSGAVHIQIEHNSATAPTLLQFSNLKRDNSEFTLGGTAPVNEFATIDFSATGGTLGTAGSQPQVKFTTAPVMQSAANGSLLKNSESGASDASVGWATVNGSSFATYDAAVGIKPVATTAFPASSAPTANAALNGSAVISGGPRALNSLKIEPSAGGQTLSLDGTGTLETNALLLAGATSYTINNTAASSGGLGGSDTRYVHVQNPAAILNLNVPVANGTARPLVKAGAGTLALASVGNAATAVSTIINEGVLRAEPGVSLPGGELRFRGGVLEITGNTFARALGNTNGTVSWSGFNPADNLGLGAGVDEDRGSGGFAAFGDPNIDATVDLNAAGPTAIAWESRFFVNSGYALAFGSATANRRVVLVDHIGLSEAGTATNYNAREFRVTDNPNSGTDSARVSGNITGALHNDLLKTGDGLLELTGTNTYLGATIVRQGQLLVNGSSANSFATDVYSGAVLGGSRIDANPTLRNVGSVRVQAGGTLAPGRTLGSTSIFNTRDLTFAGAGAKFAIEIGGITAGGNGITGYDQADVNGTVTLNGGTLELSAMSGFTMDSNSILFIVRNDGTDAVNGTFAQGSQVAFGSQFLEISYSADADANSFAGGNDIALRLVPEPGSAALVAFGALSLAARRRREAR